MKTKQILPWNVKPGMKCQIIELDRTIRTKTVERVEKSIGRFTGLPMWTVNFCNDIIPINLHGKASRLAVQNLTILL